MEYSNLSRIKKEVIKAFIRVDPTLATATEISRAQFRAIAIELLNSRKPGEPIYGIPQWLERSPNSTRGLYLWPAPTEADLEYELKNPNVKATRKRVVNTPATTEARQRLNNIFNDVRVLVTDDEFEAELAANGITV